MVRILAVRKRLSIRKPNGILCVGLLPPLEATFVAEIWGKKRRLWPKISSVGYLRSSVGTSLVFWRVLCAAHK